MIRDIFYFNHELVGRLIGQTDEGSIASSTQESETSMNRSLTLGAAGGLGTLLQSLGIGKLDVEAQQSTARDYGRKTIELRERTAESAYQSVVAQLTQENRLHRNFDSARLAALAAGGSAFCEVSDLFIPAGYDRENDDQWRLIANRSSKLVTSPSGNPNILMGMSLDKIVDLRAPQIDPLSHLAMGMRRGGLPLRVFARFDGHYIRPIVATHL